MNCQRQKGELEGLDQPENNQKNYQKRKSNFLFFVIFNTVK